jgi:hypothetical protein
MDAIFKGFAEAYAEQHGYQLSQTLSPDDSNDNLRAVWRSANFHDAKSVIKRGLQSNNPSAIRLSHEEVQGWVEIYYSFWKVIGEILAVEEQSGVNGKVSRLEFVLCPACFIPNVCRTMEIVAVRSS